MFGVRRVYLDANASTPLRDVSRAAMCEAMDLVGNPSSVHAEGRSARGVVERARAEISQALGAGGCDVVFTSGATEAAALAMAERGLLCAGVEHEAVLAWGRAELPVSAEGAVAVAEPARAAVQLANSETGIVQDLPSGIAVSDLTQAFGKIPFGFEWLGAEMGFVSAHKIGGPKGVGALVLPKGFDLAARIKGGGQELGRRSGTENVIGIAGFAAAARAAQEDLAAGLWAEIETWRDEMEAVLAQRASRTIFVGKGAKRLPNTSCMVTPGWKGETQVMAMDLAGFAISAGSACSSGKSRPGGALPAMGFEDDLARSTVRVSLWPGCERDSILRFAESWGAKEMKRRGSAPAKEDA